MIFFKKHSPSVETTQVLASLARQRAKVGLIEPQEVGLANVTKRLEMFRQMNAPTLGVIENMNYFVCNQCGKRIAQKLKVPLLGEFPINANSRTLARQSPH